MVVRRSTVTLEAVAQRAGVSMKTASNAINGTGRMAPDTRARVMDVVDQLGYKVNVAARNLIRGRTGAISLAVPTLKAAYLAELAEAVIEAARDLDLVVYVTTYPDDGVRGSRTYLEQFNPQLSDGLLLSMAEHERLDASDLDVPFPLVCLGSRHTFGKADRVASDDVIDARTATEYLLERGATSIAVVGAHTPFEADAIGAAAEGNAELRLRGVLDAASTAGHAIDPRLVGVTGYDWTIGSGMRAARSIIDSGVPFDGLVCLNDGLAIGAISALRESGLRVPDDVQVIGFDDIDEAAFLTPPLTTMDSRIDWIARTALERLVTRIENGPPAAGATPDESAVSVGAPAETLLARSRLVARGTTR